MGKFYKLAVLSFRLQLTHQTMEPVKQQWRYQLQEKVTSYWMCCFQANSNVLLD